MTSFVASPRKFPKSNTPPGCISQHSTPIETESSTTEQQVQLDWHCLMLVAFIFSLAYAGRWLVCMLLKTSLPIISLTIHLLVFFLEHQLGSTIGAGFLLWIVHGGHRYLDVPAWLQHPVDSKSPHPAEDDSHKVCSSQCAIQSQQRLTHYQRDASTVLKMQKHSVDSTVTIDLSISPVIATYTVASHNLITLPDVFSSIPSDDALVPAVVEHSEGRKTKLIWGDSQNSLDDTSESDEANFLVSSESTGSIDTLPSSDGGIALTPVSASIHTLPSSDGGIALTPIFNSDLYVIGANESETELDIVPLEQHRYITTVPATDLECLKLQHGSPKFYEGPLNDVPNLAWRQQLEQIRGEHCSPPSDFDNFDAWTGWPSLPGRPVSADEKDIKFILEKVAKFVYDDPSDLEHKLQHFRHLISSDLLAAFSSNGIPNLSRMRNHWTGSSSFIPQLERLFHQLFPQDFSGVDSKLSTFTVVQLQMLSTRRHRKECPPGLGMIQNLTPDYTRYITGSQGVTINRGASEYAFNEGAYRELDGELEYEYSTLAKLQRSPDHGGAKLSNPVLHWLDTWSDDGFYDPNAYLPCNCGQDALDAHHEYRFSVEHDYDPSKRVSCVPSLISLEEDALKADQQRKAEDKASDSPPVYPRSQTIFQSCELHTVVTDHPWILLDGVDDPNEALVGDSELPAPGFWYEEKYPADFRVPRGFMARRFDELLPRCKHGQLHPPFVDHCVRCFPDGKHEEDCAECDAHAIVRQVINNPREESTVETKRKTQDGDQKGRAQKDAMIEKFYQHQEELTALHSNNYWEGWPSFTAL